MQKKGTRITISLMYQTTNQFCLIQVKLRFLYIFCPSHENDRLKQSLFHDSICAFVTNVLPGYFTIGIIWLLSRCLIKRHVVKHTHEMLIHIYVCMHCYLFIFGLLVIKLTILYDINQVWEFGPNRWVFDRYLPLQWFISNFRYIF